MGTAPKVVPKTCIVCGAEFLVTRSTDRRGGGKTCSLSCASTSKKFLTSESERFWAKVDKTETCWNWTAAAITQYGSFGHGKLAHRVSWEMANGPIPKGIHVCHHCDNPKCVRPDHLFLGTVQDNTDDKVIKGRQAKHKLNEEKVRQIRERISKGIFQRDIAVEFGVCKGTIANIAQGRIWRHTN